MDFVTGISALYASDGLLLSPIEVMKIRKQLRNVGISVPDKPSYWRGHVLGLLRNVLASVAQVNMEVAFPSLGVLGGIAGVLISHPIDTLRTRTVAFSAPYGQLLPGGVFGLYHGAGWALAHAVSAQVLSRLIGELLLRLTGELSPLVRWLAVSLALYMLTPLELARKVSQVAAFSKAPLSAGSLLKNVNSAKSLVSLYTGGAYTFAETAVYMLLRLALLISLYSLQQNLTR